VVMMTQNSIYLASKPRYEILDGLRGVAAMIVVAFHLCETYSRGPVYQEFINHGYLGVDFFYVLSGFVIGYAYDDRWDRMSLGDFAKRRLIRLHPLVILATIFGLFMFYFTGAPFAPPVDSTPVWKLLVMFALGCLMFPAFGSWMNIRYDMVTYPLVDTAWSLFYEYIANIFYALFIRHFKTKLLIVLVAFFALLTVNLTMNIDILGLWGNRDYAAYTVIGGWSIDTEQITIGFTRLLYPFFVGLLISRLNKLIKVKGGFLLCSLIVAGIQIMPRLGGESNLWINGLYETIVILVIFPLVVSIGAGSVVKGKKWIAACKFLGFISYPLYIMHLPLVYLQKTWAAGHANAPLQVHIFVGISVFMLSIGLAYASLKLYDLPVREWLKEKLLHKKARNRRG
jgi:peptidoglycan/LPS O-acetylase OafA/YrhL